MAYVKINLSSNAPEYRQAIIEWMAKFRKNAREALHQEAKMLGMRLISFTPPNSASQGRKRVEKDINKIFVGVKDMSEFEAFEEGKRLRILETVGGEAAVRLFVRKDGTVYGVDRKLYRPDATLGEMSEFHQEHRNRRGDVSNAGQATRDIGRWKFLDKMAVPADRLREYIKMVQDRVGRAKGGWASGVIQMGGNVPGWIGVHARTAGAFFDDTASLEPSFTFQNSSEWASGDDVDRILKNAISARIRNIRTSIAMAAKKTGKPFN